MISATSVDMEVAVESNRWLVTYLDSKNSQLIRQWVVTTDTKDEAVVSVFEQDEQMGLLISVEAT